MTMIIVIFLAEHTPPTKPTKWGAFWSFGNRDKTMLLTVKKLIFADFWV